MTVKFNQLSDPWWGKALQTYLILIGHATRRETTTYLKLAEQLGEDSRAINGFLKPLYDYCGRNRLPRLNVIAVSGVTGEPGLSYPGPRESIYTEREAVYNHDWLADVPPTIEQLMES